MSHSDTAKTILHHVHHARDHHYRNDKVVVLLFIIYADSVFWMFDLILINGKIWWKGREKRMKLTLCFT